MTWTLYSNLAFPATSSLCTFKAILDTQVRGNTSQFFLQNFVKFDIFFLTDGIAAFDSQYIESDDS